MLCQNTDAALLPCISYPAFAVDDEALSSQTVDKIIRKLKGKYGFKRFLRDGYRTALEDKTRQYYKPAEIKVMTLFLWYGKGGRNVCSYVPEYKICGIFFLLPCVYYNDWAKKFQFCPL